jgi:hypothetical protein
MWVEPVTAPDPARTLAFRDVKLVVLAEPGAAPDPVLKAGPGR